MLQFQAWWNFFVPFVLWNKNKKKKKIWYLNTEKMADRLGFITSYMQKAPTSANLVNKLCYVICYTCYY